MTACPQCSKPLRELARRCPSCQADLDLLVDYVGHLQGGLERAENLTRAGELGQAFWAYLEVLEVDPNNATARRQVSQVVTAVRQFDAVTPSRRWANNLPPHPGRTRWPAWYIWVVGLMVVLLAFIIGVLVGHGPFEMPPGTDPPKMEPNDRLSDNKTRHHAPARGNPRVAA
jgi:hypothetical protein